MLIGFDGLIERLMQERKVDEQGAVEEVESTGTAIRRDILARKLSALHERSERARQRAKTLGVLFKSVASAGIGAVMLMMLLGEFDINLGPLIAGAGILGVAIGFGAQSLVRDLLSGIFMLIEDQYGVGDVGRAAPRGNDYRRACRSGCSKFRC